MDHFEAVGFPSMADEEWKYTNVAPIARGEFSPAQLIGSSAPPLTAAEISAFEYPEARDSRLVFVNGMLRSEFC